NSSVGHDSDISRGYIPLSLEGSRVSCLGRDVTFNDAGLPSSARSFFSRTGDAIVDQPEEIFVSDVELQAVCDNERQRWSFSGARLKQAGAGRVLVHAEMSSERLRGSTRTVMEFDGHLDTVISITAEKDVVLDNLQLVLPLRKEASAYLMGMGKQGGIRPKEWRYTWDVDRANNAVWLGAPHAGVQVKLKHTEDVWEVYNYRKQGVPDSWSNDGKGGCIIEERGEAVVVEAFTG